MKEKTYLIALVCDLSNINIEKKTISLRICIFSFVQCYGNQKSLRIVEEEKTVVRLTKVPNEATLQAMR